MAADPDDQAESGVEPNPKTQVGQTDQGTRLRKALEEAGTTRPQKPARVRTAHKVWLGSYAIIALVLGAALYALGLDLFQALLDGYAQLTQRLTTGALFIVVTLGIAEAIIAFGVGRLEDPGPRYNLTRLVKLLAGVVVFFVLLSLLFRNWYAAAVSLGLISVVVGFALQDPMTSFIGWIYVLIKQPYSVGDRIQMGEATGDVVAISYLDTTLWEVGGPYLHEDHPSGRIIKFPNSKVLNEVIYNYSWPLFPYIWNEIYVQIAYNADLHFVATTMREVVTEAIGEKMHKRIDDYRQLLAQTPVDTLPVKEHPVILFNVSQNTWVECSCRYLVEPRKAAAVKTRLYELVLDRLNASPDKALLPNSNNR